jgi:hypothetical protein
MMRMTLTRKFVAIVQFGFFSMAAVVLLLAIDDPVIHVATM